MINLCVPGDGVSGAGWLVLDESIEPIATLLWFKRGHFFLCGIIKPDMHSSPATKTPIKQISAVDGIYVEVFFTSWTRNHWISLFFFQSYFWRLLPHPLFCILLMQEMLINLLSYHDIQCKCVRHKPHPFVY